MTTAIIGLGNMGKGLAQRLSGQTPLLLASRNPDDAAALATTLSGAQGVSVEAAIEGADIVVLALGYDAALSVAALPQLGGKIVVDITNPVLPDFSGLQIGHTTSAAEEIQKVASGARVVKGFNTIFAGLFATDRAATSTVPVFLAGDDQDALSAVSALVEKAGFVPESVGGLDGARLLEPLAMLNIRMGYGLGKGTSRAPTWTELAA